MKTFLTETLNIFLNKMYLYLSQGDDFLNTEQNFFSQMRLTIISMDETCVWRYSVSLVRQKGLSFFPSNF